MRFDFIATIKEPLHRLRIGWAVAIGRNGWQTEYMLWIREDTTRRLFVFWFSACSSHPFRVARWFQIYIYFLYECKIGFLFIPFEFDCKTIIGWPTNNPHANESVLRPNHRSKLSFRREKSAHWMGLRQQPYIFNAAPFVCGFSFAIWNSDDSSNRNRFCGCLSSQITALGLDWTAMIALSNAFIHREYRTHFTCLWMMRGSVSVAAALFFF